jgi:hypothetical protein
MLHWYLRKSLLLLGMMRRYLCHLYIKRLLTALVTVVACFLSACSQEIYLKKEISIDVSSFYENGTCHNCISPISSDFDISKYVFFSIHGKNTVTRYNCKKRIFDKSVHIITDTPDKILPFFVDKNETIFGFGRESLTLVKKAMNDNVQIYNISGIEGGDEYNTGYFTFSSYVDANSITYLNLLRVHNSSTKENYFTRSADLPVIGSFEVQDGKAFYSQIPFLNPHPEDFKKRLPSSFFMFDIEDGADNIFFQNRCIDTIYVFNTRKQSIKKLVPQGSQHAIIPQWYNPDSMSREDAILKQNMVSSFMVNSRTQHIYRLIAVNTKERLRFALQVLDIDGKLLFETWLDENYGSFKRYGDDILILSRTKTTIDLYKIATK